MKQVGIKQVGFIEEASLGRPENLKRWLIDDFITHLSLDFNGKLGFFYHKICPVNIILALRDTPVTSLDLCASGIEDDEIVRRFAKALADTNITRLDLSNNAISDIGAKAIAEALRFTKITSLDVSNNKMSEALASEIERQVQCNRDKRDARDNAYLFATLKPRLIRLDKVIPKPGATNENVRNSIRKLSLWAAGNKITLQERNKVLEAGGIISKLPEAMTAHVLSFILDKRWSFALKPALRIYDRYHPDRYADIRRAERMKNIDLYTDSIYLEKEAREKKEECSVAPRVLSREILFSRVAQHAIDIRDEEVPEEARVQKNRNKISKVFCCC